MRDRVVLTGLLAVSVLLAGCRTSQQVTLPPPFAQVLYAGNGGCCLKIFSLPVTVSSAASVSVTSPSLSPSADSVALDNSNHVFVLDNGPVPPVVQEYNRQITGASTLFATITLTGIISCNYIATDTAGNLWMSCISPTQVYVINGPFTTPGSYAKSASATLGTAGLNAPRDLAFNAAGNLFVADSAANRIFVWTSLTNGSAPSGSLLTTGAFGVAFDAAGNLYAANTTNGSLVKWNAPVPTTGTAVAPDITDLIANTGFTVGNPRGMTFDANGNLYVGEITPTSDIRVFALGSTAFTSSSTPSVVDTASGSILDIDAGNL